MSKIISEDYHKNRHCFDNYVAISNLFIIYISFLIKINVLFNSDLKNAILGSVRLVIGNYTEKCPLRIWNR